MDQVRPKGGKVTKEKIETVYAPGAIGPYSQGVRAGELLFTSGQLPATPEGEAVFDDIEAAAKCCLDNVLAVLRAGGAGPENVLKVTIFLTDMANFASVNGVYETVFEEPYPARSCIEVAGLPKGAPIEIEAIALTPRGA